MERKMLLLLLIIFCTMFIMSGCSDKNKFAELDSYLARRNEFVMKKKAKIAFLEKQLNESMDTLNRMMVLDDLYNEYYTFRFDSAMICLDRLNTIAKQSGNEYFLQKSKIHQIVELATGGLYPESMAAIAEIDTTRLNERLVPEYYYALFWAYSYFGDYSSKTHFAEQYHTKNNWLKQKYIQITENPRYAKYIKNPKAMRNYFRGLIAQDHSKYAEACYYLDLCLKDCKVDERLYAMTALSLASCYQSRGLKDEYEKYVIKSIISDVVCPLKENLALQQFALYIHEHYPNEIDRAKKYINISLEDARFYNNRLRIIQISNILPGIIDAYQQALGHKNKVLIGALTVVLLGIIILIITIVYIRKKRDVIARQREELSKTNEQISFLNTSLSDSNSQLSKANDKLLEANILREQQMHMFLELCVANIGKLDSYRSLVLRKIKAHQAEELLKYSNTVQLTEQESLEFMLKFDRAFLSLYPRFIQQLNELLRPDTQVSLKDNHLTPELRISALIRLGVTESSDIATFLFFSPQTIYNYRSSMKRRAINRDTFEDKLAELAGV